MKKYSANKELEDILLKFGFIETTDKRDQLKGKKEFRLSKYGQKRIYFDYINIIVIQKFHMYSLGTSITLDNIVIILLYFTLKSNDQKELFYDGSFTLDNAANHLNSIKKEYADLEKYNLHRPRREKLKRIIEKSEELRNKIL
ncbi:hypothetical protein D0T53_06910 [Dysgonomonas sp. 216]|uniref:hypothetical protein n=1 Tax=Dysgonomonas sp. 216 TaxID=2302934 RepID=UPI0013D4D996|nr:hypothetical protein [Dysgonomonas sp. 216]NDW18276.1 hypothetical protein [Dysgonomonas sp. 216]NDW18644.1 hypothetical protein [Dysgonomonas sp. 216]